MKMEKIRVVLFRTTLILLILFFLGGLAFGGYVVVNTLPVDVNNKTSKEFKIEAGWGKNKICDELKKSDFIKNSFIMKLYLKVNNKVFYPGTYNISKSMSLEEIVTVLTTSKPLEEKGITITFIEGKRFPYYVKKISENFNYSEKEILDVASNKEFLNKLIKDYWFINEDILNKDLYYPLEGYIFPDTYTFNTNAPIEDILNTLIKQMDKKLESYKDIIIKDKIKVHDLLTMASMVELEAVTTLDRKVLVGIFENRININMTLGSDVTTYYATKKELTEKLTIKDLNSCNAYNTRGTCVKGLPVGPIACVSLSSIDAVINKTENDYLYFVADKNNKLYFAKNGSEHNKNVETLKALGLWA